jgi:medium-chain acyl-[acyl-carrier-protein] hydrolase
MSSEGWAVCCSGRQISPAMRLICFPFAGSGAAAFHGWRLPAELSAEVWAVRPPGRETRRREPLLRDIEPLLEEVSQRLDEFADRPFAFFGHSMGALLAFELTRLQIRRGGPLPIHLFLSAHRAPGRPSKREPMSGLSDDELLARLLEMAGSGPTAIRDPELLMLTAPVLRADLELCESYRYRPGPPLPMPVTCFAAVDDSEVDVADVAAWQLFASTPGRLITVAGGHLFLREHSAEMLGEIAYDLVMTSDGRDMQRTGSPAPHHPAGRAR